MATCHVVAVEPASGRGESVVVQVQQEGEHPLDVRLVGCEGENPYIMTLEQRNLGHLKHKFKGSDDDWATVLSYFLLQKPPQPDHADILRGVRLVYTLKKDNLELTIRQDVQGIKVTLGEIVLKQDDEFEFNPFEWARVSAIAHRQTLAQIAELKAQISTEQQAKMKLNAQLEDFIEAKNEAETVMLQQFMQLLNEKKRKIRDQSRLLAGAKVDKDSAITVQATRAASKARKAGASRTSKRKAPAQVAEPDTEAESESEQMGIDQAKTDEQQDDEAPEAVTPDRSDEETDAEDNAPSQQGDRLSETIGLTAAAQDPGEEAIESKGVPPPRSLPFGRPATRSRDVRKKSLSPPPDNDNDDDDDDETDDEEL